MAAKGKSKKSADREYVWLQCTESGDLNYRTSLRVKGGIAEKMKDLRKAVGYYRAYLQAAMDNPREKKRIKSVAATLDKIMKAARKASPRSVSGGLTLMGHQAVSGTRRRSL